MLDVIHMESLPANSITVGSYLIKELTRVSTKYPLLADVRGNGLFIGMEFIWPEIRERTDDDDGDSVNDNVLPPPGRARGEFLTRRAATIHATYVKVKCNNNDSHR